MTLTLDAATEQRIQQKIKLGHSVTSPRSSHAPSIHSTRKNRGRRKKSDPDQHLAASMAPMERGEGIPGNKFSK